MAISQAIHPFLFAIFRILSLFAHNIGEVDFEEIRVPIIAIVIGVFVLWAFLLGIIKNNHKRGIVISLVLLVAFIYKPLSDLLYPVNKLIETGLQLHVILALFILGIPTIFVSYKTLRASRDLKPVTHFLNVMAICTLVMPASTMAFHYMKPPVEIESISGFVPPKVEGSITKPDVYYIVFDGYGREDVLKEIFDHDNSDFVNHLRKSGFYVADNAHSNYCQTYLSLSSSLNFTYLDELAKELGPKSKDREVLKKMIRESNALKFFKEQGYEFVVFDSGYSGTQIKTADTYLGPDDTFSEFQAMISKAAAIPGISESQKRKHDLHRARHLYTLKTISNMPKSDKPRFVFTHIVCPHPPFLFDNEGGYIQPEWDFSFADGNAWMRRGKYEDFIKGYKAQIIYFNTRIIEAVDGLIVNSPDSIIIMQGDHGSGSNFNLSHFDKTNMWERFSILNAYYLPNDGYKKCYPEITPVNTFRMIFNHYFGTEYEMLEDKSYYCTWNKPYVFTDVTEQASKVTPGVPTAQ